ncbi:MAG: radical SAM protein [Spirochaetota bacterium]
MRKLNIAVIEVAANSPTRSWYGRVMRPNLTSIMPQVIAVWCEEEGHKVTFTYYSGYENMGDELPEQLDLVFIGAFTTSAQVAYALSAYFQSNGAVTVLGGPHARAYPTDARKYFDYVVGFTDKNVIVDILQDCSQYRPTGTYLSANSQPSSLPSLRQRWNHTKKILEKARIVKIVPMLGSLGCPYNCSFCVDSVVKYQPLNFDTIREDLRFIRQEMKRPIVAWHDPNFGVQFDEYLNLIEESVPPGSITFIAESSLSLLSEKNVIRLKKNGFKAVLPGIESWYEMGNKSRTGSNTGEQKVRMVSEHVNMILRYLPYLQANFVLGLDCDEGNEPFELTKLFLDLSPAAFPAFSLFTAFGNSAPMNLQYQKDGRMIGFPFHFLNNNGVMNVKPKNYEWRDFYGKLIGLYQHAFSHSLILRRLKSNRGWIPRAMNLLRAISLEGWGKIEYYKRLVRLLNEDVQVRHFFEQKTIKIPLYFEEIIRATLGPLAQWLPQKAMYHDPYAYLKSEEEEVTTGINGEVL